MKRRSKKKAATGTTSASGADLGDELERNFLAEAKRLGMSLTECIEYLARRKLRAPDCESLIDVHELSRLIKASEKRK